MRHASYRFANIIQRILSSKNTNLLPLAYFKYINIFKVSYTLGGKMDDNIISTSGETDTQSVHDSQ